MLEIEVTLSLPDVNNDPITKSCSDIVLEVEWSEDGEMEYINVRADHLPQAVQEWLCKEYEAMYGYDKAFTEQIDKAIQEDIQWHKQNQDIPDTPFDPIPYCNIPDWQPRWD
jgi:hypothetical protein